MALRLVEKEIELELEVKIQAVTGADAALQNWKVGQHIKTWFFTRVKLWLSVCLSV